MSKHLCCFLDIHYLHLQWIYPIYTSDPLYSSDPFTLISDYCHAMTCIDDYSNMEHQMHWILVIE